MRQDIDGQLELPAHAAHHHQLLVILLAKDRDSWLHTGKQLEHDCGDAGKKAGAKVSFEDAAEVCWWLNLKILRLRVHLLFIRSKQYVDVAVPFEFLDI